MRGTSLLLLLGLLLGAPAFAQTPPPATAPDASTPPPSSEPPSGMDTGEEGAEPANPEPLERGGRHHHRMSTEEAMSFFGQARLEHPPREASGTSWQPDATPRSGLHLRARAWDFLIDFNLFAGYDAQTSPRGGHQWLSTNWFSLVFGRKVQGGDLAARVMLSAEPLTLFNGERLTAGARGYPLLLQTGETYVGKALVDVQHPQELLMELALTYKHPLGQDLGLFFYVAPAGEPALGPVAFLQRASALGNPFAPLGHHWQDSTHVSFGVVTAGVSTQLWKLEASWFNGREPNEYRWDLDLASLDSLAARFSINPTENLSAQVSYGYLRSPEALHPGPVQRITASASYGLSFSDSHWASTFVWGRNLTDAGPSDALLLESSLDLGHRHLLFGRAEWVQKDASDFPPIITVAPTPRLYPVAALTLGYVYQFRPVGQLLVGLGAAGTVNGVPEDLKGLYGSLPLGGMAYLRLGFAPPSRAAREARAAPQAP